MNLQKLYETANGDNSLCTTWDHEGIGAVRVDVIERTDHDPPVMIARVATSNGASYHNLVGAKRDTVRGLAVRMTYHHPKAFAAMLNLVFYDEIAALDAPHIQAQSSGAV